MTPEDFSPAFAFAFGDRNPHALAELIAADGTVHSLTGIWAEGREQAEAAFAAETAGIFAHARLVTGRGSVLPLSPEHALLRQRFVVTGAIEENGAELPRFGAMLVALLARDALNWRAVSLTFTMLG